MHWADLFERVLNQVQDKLRERAPQLLGSEAEALAKAEPVIK